MKILILPDIHGKKLKKKPCEHPENYDKIVFLGDYHDPYPFQVSQDNSRYNFRELAKFVENNKHKCVCLAGNHDLSYLVGGCACRYDQYHEKEIKSLLEKLDLKLFYEVKDEEATYLFTHAGVLPVWLDHNKISLEDFKNMKLNNPALMDISPRRGGDSIVGSPVWGDLGEYVTMKHLPNTFQIFGHTQLVNDDAIIKEDYACLDCRQAFILDTDSGYLTKYKEQ